MEKGPSVYAEYWISDEQEVEKFGDHAHEFGYTKILKYSRSAKNLALSNERGIIEFVAHNGSRYITFPLKC